MPEYTKNLNLEKPTKSENAKIGVLNENFDKIDNAHKITSDSILEAKSEIKDLKSLIEQNPGGNDVQLTDEINASLTAADRYGISPAGVAVLKSLVNGKAEVLEFNSSTIPQPHGTLTLSGGFCMQWGSNHTQINGAPAGTGTENSVTIVFPYAFSNLPAIYIIGSTDGSNNVSASTARTFSASNTAFVASHRLYSVNPTQSNFYIVTSWIAIGERKP